MLLASGLTAVVRGGRALGVAAAARRRRTRWRGARCASASLVAAVLAPAADLRGRLARPEHARAPAGQDRRDGGDLADREGRAAGALRDPEREDADATTTRSRSPSGASLILRHDANGGAEGPGRLRRRPPAGGAGVLRLPHHGGHRRADARARPGSAPGSRGASAQAPRWLLWTLRRLHLLRLGGDARRLDRHRDRAPALARARACCARARRWATISGARARREPHRLRAHLRGPVRSPTWSCSPTWRAKARRPRRRRRCRAPPRRRGRGLRRTPWTCR